MKDVVIDSNILFSSLRGTASRTRKKILTSKDNYFTPNFIISEIFNHKERIIKNSEWDQKNTINYLTQIINRITFVNEKNISLRSYIRGFELCKAVDQDDTPFVALAIDMDCLLWTRDKPLKAELRRKGFKNFYREE